MTIVVGFDAENSMKTALFKVDNTIWTVTLPDDHGIIGAEAARIVVVGGGAYYFSSMLQRDIPHAIVPRNPEYANVEGYAVFGTAIGDRICRSVPCCSAKRRRPPKRSNAFALAASFAIALAVTIAIPVVSAVVIRFLASFIR